MLKEKYLQYQRLRFDTKTNLTKYELTLAEEIDRMRLIKSQKYSKSYYWFITIRPSQEIAHDLIKDRLDNYILKSKNIDKFCYVIEVTESNGQGFHFHLLIENNKYEKNKIIRDIEKTLNRSGKNYYNIITDRAMIQVDPRPFKDKDNTISYMEGRKKDPHKWPSVNNCIEWRRANPTMEVSRAYGFSMDLLENPYSIT